MPNGKRAGERCVHLLPDNLCALFGKPERPQICADFPAMEEHCGANREEALSLIARLERETTPDATENR